MTLLGDVKRAFHPHYVFNVLLGLMFYFLKVTPPFCYTLFDDCELEMKEWELLTFLGCFIVLKNRKQATYLTYLSTVCMFAKLLSVILFLRQNPALAFIYVLLCLCTMAFIPEPTYAGPSYVTYFNGETLEDELNRDKRVTWIVCFYAAWSPKCVTFAPIFSEMSAKYSLDNIKFGKIDLTRFPKVAETYSIDTSTWSKQIPTLILFQAGKPVSRQPVLDGKGRPYMKFIFTEENVVRYFELNEVYLQNKKNPIKKNKGKKDEETDGQTDKAEKSSGKPKEE